LEVNISGDETVPGSGRASRNELTSCLSLFTTREKLVGDANAVAATVRQLNKVAANRSCFAFFIIYLNSFFRGVIGSSQLLPKKSSVFTGIGLHLRNSPSKLR
jgi:hypothetical protein